MARGFFGGKIGGGARMGGAGKNMSRTVVDTKTGLPRPMTPEEMTKKLTEERMKAFETQYDKEGSTKKFGVGGPAEKKEKKSLSKNAKETLAKIAAVQAKRKAAKAEVEIIPKSFGGMYPGRIEKNGNIYNGFGENIGKVNLKNGKIVSKQGLTVGKYKAGSGTCEVNITRFIANSMTKPRPGAQGGPGAAGGAGGGWNPMTGGIGGGGSSGGSIYGDSGGFWGPKKDDDKGWW